MLCLGEDGYGTCKAMTFMIEGVELVRRTERCSTEGISTCWHRYQHELLIMHLLASPYNIAVAVYAVMSPISGLYSRHSSAGCFHHVNDKALSNKAKTNARAVHHASSTKFLHVVS